MLSSLKRLGLTKSARSDKLSLVTNYLQVFLNQQINQFNLGSSYGGCRTQ